MIVKLLNEHHLEFLSFKGGCTDSSESTLVKLPHCWKSRAMAHFLAPHCHNNSMLVILYTSQMIYMYEALCDKINS